MGNKNKKKNNGTAGKSQAGVHNNQTKVPAKTSNAKVKVTVKSTTTYGPKIIDRENFRNVGMILMDGETMQDIRKKSGPLANSCEYQVHYWALVFRCTHESQDSYFDICVPTTFFNYKTEVTGGHIDFELEDVDAISELVYPLHQEKMNLLLGTGIEDKLKNLLPAGYNIDMMETNLNTIHKHPGGPHAQSFSTTDLGKSHTYNTGVVFPLAEGEFKPNFAGIMAHEYAGDRLNKVAHFEYRVANGKIGGGPQEKIIYEQGRCIAYVKAQQNTTSMIEQLIGITKSVDSYQKLDEITATEVTSATLFQSIKTIWDETDFKQSTDLVIPSNVYEPKKTYATNNVNAQKKHYGHNAAATVNNSSTNKQFTNSERFTGNVIPRSGSNNQSLNEDLNIHTPEYIAASKEIDWKTEADLRRLTFLKLKETVTELADHFYDNIKITFSVEALGEQGLIDEYLEIKEHIEEEIKQYDSSIAKKKKELDDKSETVFKKKQSVEVEKLTEAYIVECKKILWRQDVETVHKQTLLPKIMYLSNLFYEGNANLHAFNGIADQHLKKMYYNFQENILNEIECYEAAYGAIDMSKHITVLSTIPKKFRLETKMGRVESNQQNDQSTNTSKEQKKINSDKERADYIELCKTLNLRTESGLYMVSDRILHEELTLLTNVFYHKGDEIESVSEVIANKTRNCLLIDYVDLTKDIQAEITQYDKKNAVQKIESDKIDISQIPTDRLSLVKDLKEWGVEENILNQASLPELRELYQEALIILDGAFEDDHPHINPDEAQQEFDGVIEHNGISEEDIIIPGNRDVLIEFLVNMGELKSQETDKTTADLQDMYQDALCGIIEEAEEEAEAEEDEAAESAEVNIFVEDKVVESDK